jgi:hypothetical protein
MENEITGTIYGFTAGIENGAAYIQESRDKEKIFPKPGDVLYTEYGGMSTAVGIVPIYAYLHRKGQEESQCVFFVNNDDNQWEISSEEVLNRLEALLQKVSEISGCTFEK